jgi:ATP-dependent Lon protease
MAKRIISKPKAPRITTSETEVEVSTIPKRLTVLPLRDTLIFPYMIFPVLIGRASSLKAINEALEREKFIFLAAQKDATMEEPAFKDIYQYGTVAKVLQVLRLPNNLLKVLVEGVAQGKIKKTFKTKDFLEAEIEIIHSSATEGDKELEAMLRQTSELFANYVKANQALPPEVVAAFENIDDPVRKLFYAAANVQQKAEIKQAILEKTVLNEQYFELITLLKNETELLKIEEEIDTRVQDSIQKTQRKYFIQEQIRVLQKELGEDDESTPELAVLKEAIENAGMSPEIKKRALEEFDKLKRTQSMSPEFGVNRSYLEWLTAVPWDKVTPDNMSVDHVCKILDDDHYGLEKPKERILEYIALLNLVGSLKGQILCFVGPPGVGKTSLARSIARATGRNFVRISLGGVRDEAEIRGHRRTYIGAMPGKLIQTMKRAGTINPVILLDEIDKMSTDFRGDPSSALLEVLDPEQNVAFNDHYLEVDYDLSSVLFVATANVKYDIPLPLLDRMEVIELSSYLDHEKLQIAKKHIIPKLLKEFGMDEVKISFTDEGILKIIREYTRESGVRNLEREIGTVLRRVAKELVQDVEEKLPATEEGDKKKKAKLRQTTAFKNFTKKKQYTIDEKTVEVYLKNPRFKDRKEDLKDTVGVATGLAWTSVGGDTLPVEVTIMPGSEKLTLTGKLGDVMKESATAALSYVRANYAILGVPEEFSKGKEIHIHVPEGAIPKDGPSAGITMTLALISAASGKALRGDLAMTGEVNLRGQVLPIGGLKEKLLAAKRLGITTVLIPKDNEKDLSEVHKETLDSLKVIPVSTIQEALPVAFREAKDSKKKPVLKTPAAKRKTMLV